MAEAVRQALGGRPGPVLLSLPEDLLDEPIPDDAQADSARPPAVRATRRRDPRGHRVPGIGRAPGHPGRRRRAARADLDRADSASPSCSRSRSSPPGDAPTSSRTTTRSTSGWPASAPRRAVRDRLDAADALVVIGSRLNEATTFGYTMPRAGPGAGPTSTSSRARRPARRHRRSPWRPTPRRSSRRPTSGSSARPSWTRRWSRPARRNNRDGPGGLGGGLGRRCDAVGRAGRPSRPDDRDAPAGPARRRDPDHRRRQLRELGRSWLPVPSSRHVPRPDLGSDGLRPAGGHRRRAGPSRSAGRRARRRRRPRR